MAKPKRDARWLSFIRSLPCCMCLAPPPSEAHHSLAHKPGLGMKASDHHTLPLCGGPQGCHAGLHTYQGRFKGWTREQRKAWERGKVDLYQPRRDEMKDSMDEAPDDAF